MIIKTAFKAALAALVVAGLLFAVGPIIRGAGKIALSFSEIIQQIHELRGIGK